MSVLSMYEGPKFQLKVCTAKLLTQVKVKMATIVEGDPKAVFSIAALPRCREGRYSFLDCSTLPLIRTLKC